MVARMALGFDTVQFGERVRKLRLQRGMTQAELAGACGLSVSFLGHVERGTRMASIPTLCALSEVLDTSTDFLLKGGLETPVGGITDVQRKVLMELRQAFGDAWFGE